MALGEMLQNLQGLQGLQANKIKMDEFQTQQMNRTKAADLLRSYQETQDPAKLNEAILLDADLANNVLAGIGIQDKARMQRAADDYIALTGSLGNKDQFNQLAAKRLDNILAAGGNPSDTLAVVKAYNEQGPEAARAMLQPVGAALVNKGVLRPELFAPKQQEPMTAYQQASTDLRKQELMLKAIENQQKGLERQLAKETNQLKQQELQLKLEETKQKMADAQRQKEVVANEKDAGLESARMNVDNMLNTVARVSKTPAYIVDNATGPIDQMLPTLKQGTADFEELVNTLGSQAFLSQIPLIKGMGQLSNAEGEKLQASLQNFSLRQSPERLKENLAEAQRLLLKARSNIAKQYGKPESKPDVPAAQGAITIGNYKVVEVNE